MNVTFTGFEQLTKRLRDAPDKIVREVDAEMSLAADDIESGAINDAPSGAGGILRAEIQKTKNGEMNYGIFSNALYSGYVEFGTRSKVSIPPGLEEVAAAVQSSKHISSVDAKEAIYEWCRTKGIAKEFWWPIFISIMVNGINPHPFFFKQLDLVQPELIKRIENILNSI